MIRISEREFRRGLVADESRQEKSYLESGLGVTVFACVLPMTTNEKSFDMNLVWDVYKTRESLIRTVCLGIIDAWRTDHTGKKCDRYTLEHSAFALLNNEHPEEFSVEIGIKKSFDRFLFSLLSRSDFFIENNRHNRKGIWGIFNSVLDDYIAFTKCEPYGVWSQNWKSPDEYPRYNTHVRALLK